MKRQHMLWLALAACLGAVVWAAGLEADDSASNDSKPRNANTTPRHAPRNGASSSQAPASLARLERGLTTREPITRLKHDPFSIASFAPPPPPPPPPPKPTAPPLRFKYQGQLREGKVPVVFLDHNGQMLIVREGDTVAGQYKVLAISDTAMQFEYLPLAQRQTLTFGR